MERGSDTFERFYAAEGGPLIALLYAVTGNWQLAEDLAQEAFVRAYDRWSSVERFEQPDAWLRTVALNLARSKFRRRGAEKRARARTEEPISSIDDPDPLPDELARFWRAVRALPRMQALAISLAFLEDRRPSEMTEVLGCSASTARVHLHRARKRLQAQLGDLDAADDVKDLA